MFNKFTYLFLLTLSAYAFTLSTVYSQQNEIDSLKNLISKHKLNDTTSVILLNQLAYSYYSVNIDDLKTSANDALLLSKKLKYPPGEAIAYKNMGLGSMLTNGDPIALEYFERALKIFNQLNDKINQARVLNNIGYYYSNLQKHQQSVYYFNLALDKIAGLNKIHLQSILLGNIGNAYVELKDFKKSRIYYLKELALAKRSGETDVMITSYINLADLNVKLNEFDEAKTLLQKIDPLKNTADFRKRDLVDILRLDGEINTGLKNYAQAKRLLIEALAMADKIGSIDQRLAINKNLYQLYDSTGNYKNAILRNEIYHKLNDSISNTNRNQLIALYQTRFEIEKRDRENQRLKDSAEKDRITISDQHQTQLILFFTLIGIIGILFYFKHINGQIKAKNEIINKQNSVLESTNQVKDKIFSVISHDLRSPITQAANLLDLLETGDIDGEEMAFLVPGVKDNISGTLELLDNLLVSSKNQLQGFQYNPEPFNLRKLIEENIKGLRPAIQSKGLVIQNNIPENILPVADREMIKIVLRNLISNAVKFTPRGGYISVNAGTKDDQVIVSVEDTGIGIKEIDIDKIFSFTSHTTLGTNNEKGTGLGLKICNDFIVMNKGRMWLESKLNYGSKFYISFPC